MMHVRYLILLASLLMGGLQPDSRTARSKPAFTLWQLPEQTHTQMMSYVIRTRKGKVLLIDGGMPGDAPYLKAFVKNLGGEVEAWFLTHPHVDHCGAMAEILDSRDGINIKRLYASIASDDWIREHEPESLNTVVLLNQAVKKAGKSFNEMQAGEVFEFDGTRVEVLAVKNPEIHENALNNSCVVLRVQDSHKSVLFLGDLGQEGGEKLLKSRFRNRLRADYVQMAHHGQNGVAEDFYRFARPSYCLWPTPKWLWDNDTGKGKGSGPWKTLEVRQWMDQLHVKRHYVTSIDGLSKID